MKAPSKEQVIVELMLKIERCFWVGYTSELVANFLKDHNDFDVSQFLKNSYFKYLLPNNYCG